MAEEYAFCMCFKYATGDSLFFQQDISRSVLWEIAGYYGGAYDSIDSLAMKFAGNMQPSPIADHEGRKAIMMDLPGFLQEQAIGFIRQEIG